MISMCFVLNFQFCGVSFSWTKAFLIVFNRCRWSQCEKQFGKFLHDSSFTDFEPFFLFCALFQCVIWSFWIIVTQWFESLWHNDLSTESIFWAEIGMFYGKRGGFHLQSKNSISPAGHLTFHWTHQACKLWRQQG